MIHINVVSSSLSEKQKPQSKKEKPDKITQYVFIILSSYNNRVIYNETR